MMATIERGSLARWPGLEPREPARRTSCPSSSTWGNKASAAGGSESAREGDGRFPADRWWARHRRADPAAARSGRGRNPVRSDRLPARSFSADPPRASAVGRAPGGPRGDRRAPPDDAMRCEPTGLWRRPAAHRRLGRAMCAWRRRGRDADPNSSGATTGDAAPRAARAHGRAQRPAPASGPRGCARGRRDSLRDASSRLARRRRRTGGPTHAATETTVHATPCAGRARGRFGAGAHRARGGVRPAGRRWFQSSAGRAGGGSLLGRDS